MARQKAHILICPYPAPGHMIPLLDFTHQLSIRGLDITVVITGSKNVSLLAPILSRNPSIRTLVLPFPEHPSIPSGVENVKDLSFDGFSAMMCALRQLHVPIKEWFRSHPLPPTAVVFDLFLGCINGLAADLGVPGYVFSPSGGLALSVIYSLWRNFPKRENPNDDNELISFPGIPNSPNFPWWQISPIYRRYVDNENGNDPLSETIKANFAGDMASFGLVINTVSELEQQYLDHLKEVLGHDRVWAVGPVLPPGDDQSGGSPERGGASSIPANEVLEWLDNCKDHNSVLYVCFGSIAVLTDEQMEALTLGLEKSGVKFILSIHGANDGLISSDFEERVAGRGLVIKGWSPQVLILRHPCVGAFFTHCGWNSILEGVASGMPLLTWPMSADQFADAALVVDELKIGCRVCEGDETVPNPDELAAVLAKAIGDDDDDFQAVRRRALELQKAALEAVQGGSSFKSLDDLALHFSEMSSNSCKQHS